jgi:drug/metabolite transporter (DMT)-like permease
LNVNKLVERFSVLLVAMAAMLWGTDTLFRKPLLGHLSMNSVVASTQLVFLETVILTGIVLPLLWRRRDEISKIGRGQWLAIICIGAGAQALATVLFTLSFTYFHFIETLLLQKTQPLIAILLASIFLRERISSHAWIWVTLAIVGAYLIVIPDPLHPEAAWADFHIQAGLLAIGAAALWGTGTVLGRYALRGISFPSMTGLRFATGLPVLGIVLFAMGGASAFGQYRMSDAGYYLGLALIPGLIAMLLYYRGLASTPASVATLAELAFPITGLVVNMFVISPAQRITGMQIAGIAVLWLALAVLDWVNARSRPRSEPALVAQGASA